MDTRAIQKRPAWLSIPGCLLGGLLFMGNSAHAAQCSFSNVGGTLIDFGILSAAQSSPVLETTTLNFTCTDGLLQPVNYDIAIDAGSSGDFNQRTMRFANRQITYNLYRDPVYTSIFGDGQIGSNSQTASGLCFSGVPCVVPVYGRLDGGQSLQSGAYSDTVIVTISF